MRTPKGILVILSTLVLFLFLTEVSGFSAPKLPSMIGIATSGLGTAGHTTALAYGPVMEKFLGVPVRVMPADSTKTNFSQIREKKALFVGGGVSPSSQGTVIEGRHPFCVEGWGPQKLGTVWMGYDGPYGFAVRGDSSIKSIKDLKGKKIAWYSASPGWMSGAEGALRFGGLTLKDVELVRLGSYAACARAVVEGKADADYLMVSSAVTFEIAESPSGIRFLPMPLEDKEGWARYHELNPLIARGISEKGVKVARGIPMANHVFTCSTYLDVDSEHMYHIARFFGEAYDQYKDKNKDLEDMSLKKMREFLDTKCLPVHPGVIKYLKEKNLWMAEDDKWNQERLEEMKQYEKAWMTALKEANTKGIKVDLNNEKWLKHWGDYLAKLPPFKMR